MGYDDWLEAPYQRAYEEGDRYIDWCEAHDFDPDDPESEDAYNEFCEEVAESYAEAMADRALEREFDHEDELNW